MTSGARNVESKKKIYVDNLSKITDGIATDGSSRKWKKNISKSIKNDQDEAQT